MPQMTLDAARAWTAAIFERAGASAVAAQSTARALVAAEADGLKGHGFARISTYAAMLKSGKVRGSAVPVLRQTRPGALIVDAACGFAYPAIDLACEALPQMARTNGVAIAGITRSGHAGAIGHHVERLAEHGLVVLFFANTPAAISPWGGKKAVFGTNPLAFAAPLPGRPPLVIDMAVSTVARATVLAAKQAGQPIPEGWALDADGRPTTDAAAGLAGTMAPLGGAKGAALALMVEVLGAALVGSQLSFDATSFLDAEGEPPETGQCMIAIDPAGLGHGGFGAAMTRLATEIEAQSGARLPGARRLAARAAAVDSGVEVTEALAQEFGTMG